MCSTADYNHENKFKSYDIKFHEHDIKTIVTSDPSIVDEWISKTYEIHKNKILDQNKILVGLDTEWRLLEPVSNLSKRSKPKSNQYKVALLQLCTHHNRCLIFQLVHAQKIPSSLAGLLEEPNSTFTGVGIKQDKEKLLKDWGLSVDKTIDVAISAAEKFGIKEYKSKGLKELADKILGKKMEKPKKVVVSEWDVKELRDDQVEYACVDAFVSFLLGMEVV